MGGRGRDEGCGGGGGWPGAGWTVVDLGGAGSEPDVQRIWSQAACIRPGVAEGAPGER